MSCSRSSREFYDETEMKWTCKACTYSNYPRSKKCTVCCQPRNTSLIIGDIVANATTTTPGSPHNQKQSGGHGNEKDPDDPRRRADQRQRDIYKTRGEMHSPSSDKWWAAGSALQKWPCQVCTYENGVKNARCVMCFTKRGSQLPPTLPPNVDYSSAINELANQAAANLHIGMSGDEKRVRADSLSNKQQQQQQSHQHRTFVKQQQQQQQMSQASVQQDVVDDKTAAMVISHQAQHRSTSDLANTATAAIDSDGEDHDLDEIDGMDAPTGDGGHVGSQ